ncbi:MAG: hypothetical protein HY860_00930 [Chlamydiales bacterium]|nr:hypothetical protein [Chlamydiales bacterium]
MRNISHICCLLILLTGCHISPRLALKGAGGRNAYNMALQTTSNEQLLLNLVRLRYCDSPYFLNVDSITTQFTFGAGLSTSIPIPGFDQDNPGVFGGDVSWKNQPTIQYTPLEGEAFAQHLLQPIDLMLIQYLVYSGWDVDRIFKLTVQSLDGIDNIPTAAAFMPEKLPQFEQFYEITKLMRKLQLSGDLQIGAKSNHHIDDKQKEKNDDYGALRGSSLQISFSTASEEGRRLCELLPGSSSFDGRCILDMNLGFMDKHKTGIMPRSILSCMHYLSLGVDVPKIHRSMVIHTLSEENALIDWSSVIGSLMSIKSSRRYPQDAYVTIKYKGYWFYISDFDLNSKKSFALLQGLYNLQAGGTPKTGPILSIPLGR